MKEMEIVEVGLDSLDLRYGGLRARRPGAERRLLASLGEAGQQSPVIVVPGAEAGSFVLIEGRKRVRALKRMGADAVKAAVWTMPAAEALVAAYQMQQGAGWNALEEGWLVWELSREGELSLGEVERRLDRSKGWASRRLGLVESLPDAAAAGVQKGRIGAYAAMKYLVPLARANIGDCEKLAEKISEKGLSSREVGLLYEHWRTGARESVRRMLEDPVRFLRASEAARRGKEDPALSEAQARGLRDLEVISGISMGLSRRLPEAWGWDADATAAGKLERAWERCRERWELLGHAVAGLLAAQGRQVLSGREDDDAGKGQAGSDLGACEGRAQPAADREGAWGGAQHGQEDRQERPGAGGQGSAREPAGAVSG
jgi:hypothetical protein